MSSPKARRRQRSTRLVVAVVLIVLAALAVAGAVLSGSWLLVTSAAVLGVVLGAGATRITHSELMLARQDAARDRAEQALAYREITEVRTTEHARYDSDMTARLARQEDALTELEQALGAAQRRAAEASRKLHAESRRAQAAETEGRSVAARLSEAEARAAETALRVSELEQELDVVKAELESWQTMPARRHA